MEGSLEMQKCGAVWDKSKLAPLVAFYNLLEQDFVAMLAAKELGVAPEDFARVFIERRDDGSVILHAITSGEEGSSVFLEGLNKLIQVEKFSVTHSKVRRYSLDDFYNKLWR